MNNKTINAGVWIIVGLVLGMFVLVMTSRSNGYNNFGMMGFGQNRIGNQVANNRAGGISSSIDRHFIEQMIPHHDGAVAMAQLALIKSKRLEIKTLANAIVEAQTKEIEGMSVLYIDWFGMDVAKGRLPKIGGGMMSEGGMHMGGGDDMKTLETAADFDKVFIEQMIPHHQLAIMMARMLEAGTNKPEMRELAKNIIESQTKEIQEMQGWYQQWYK